MSRLALVFALLANACTTPPTDLAATACTGKCDGPAESEGWTTLSALPPDEQAQIRADLDQTPTAIDLATFHLHRRDLAAFRIYWASDQPGADFAGSRPAMLARLGGELVRARARYVAMGFALPEQIRIYVAEHDAASPQPNGTVCLGHHAVEIDLPRPLVTGWSHDDPQGAVSATPVHELFHVAQYFAYEQRFASPLPDWHPSNLWITEAMAVYMEAMLVDAPQAWRTQYATWGESLTLFGLGCAGSCKKEWYQRVLFLRFLSAAGLLVDHHDFWQRLVEEADLTQPGAATAFLDRYLGGALLDAWARFASAYELAPLQRDRLLPGIEGLSLAFQISDRPAALGDATLWSVDLWPLGGTRVASFSRHATDGSATLTLDTADAAHAKVRALVWDAQGGLLGTIAAGGAALALPDGEGFSVTLTSTEPTAHTTAQLHLVAFP